MKALNAITSRLRNPRSKSLRAGVMALAGVAVLSAMAATHHRPQRAVAATVDDMAAPPVAGINYRMRLDTQRSRVQFFGPDARLAGIVPADTRHCHANLAALQPGHSCDQTAAAPGVVLPAALRARMLQQGGVLFVDGDNAQNARDASFAQKGP